MIDKKTDHLALPLPDEKNMLEDDCPRIREAFRKVDEHAATTDTALAARLAQANSADDSIAALQARATATEQTQGVTAARVTQQGQTLLALSASLTAKLDDAPPTQEGRGAIRVGAGLHLETGENGEQDVLAVSLAELGGQLLLNEELWLTESGTWTAKSTGWHEITVWHGGGASFWDPSNNNGACGCAYAPMTYLRFYHAGDTVPFVIGAGGLAGVLWSEGITTFGDLPTNDDHDKVRINWIRTGRSQIGTNRVVVEGVGVGGGRSGGGGVAPPTFYGAGAALVYEGDNVLRVGDGAQGAIHIRWHDPAKAAGPLPAPALLSARRMASRAAAAPATVNLYAPETGQGSVWREEDAEAKLAEGLITEEAWLAICAAREAEEHAAWLADPETEAERFGLLRAARDAKLAATDYLVAPDYPLTEEQRAAVTAYRQALRDLPAQEGAPWDGGGETTPWPESPAITKVTA